MSADVWYLDTSALVKTVIEELESRTLLLWLADKDRLVVCELARVETVRAVRVSDPGAVPRARQVLAALTLIRLDDGLYDLAAGLEPASLRSLDAIHLAAALSVGRDLAGIVTYDPHGGGCRRAASTSRSSWACRTARSSRPVSAAARTRTRPGLAGSVAFPAWARRALPRQRSGAAGAAAAGTAAAAGV